MKVPITKIRPNPFQVRKHFDRAAIEALAAEIDALGFWTPLRVRPVDGHYELCFGHRRLEALKHLKWKDVEVDLVKLSDDDMAIQSLVENLQREGLTDTEKADGIRRLAQRLNPNSQGMTEIDLSRISALIGIGDRRILELLQIEKLGTVAKKAIAQRQISGATAIRAARIGGDAMVRTAIKRDLSTHTLRKIATELAAIPEPKIRERVTNAVVAGQVRDPEGVREQAKRVSRQVAARAGKRPPPDLKIVIRAWTQTMNAWSKKLDEVAPYRDYITEDADGFENFQTATRALIEKLKKFL